MKQSIAFFLIVLVAVSCNSNLNNSNHITTQDIKTIKNEINRYEEIIHNKNRESIRTMFTDDVILIRPNDSNLVGIENLLSIHYAEIPDVPEFWKSAEEIKGSGNIAYTYGYYGFTKGVKNGKYFEIRERTPDGSWPISRLTWSEIKN